MNMKTNRYNNEPTKIIYKPHCGNCGALINNDIRGVEYSDIYEKSTDKMLYKKLYTQVFPVRCTNCGAIFNCIEIPMPKKFEDIFLGE